LDIIQNAINDLDIDDVYREEPTSSYPSRILSFGIKNNFTDNDVEFIAIVIHNSNHFGTALIEYHLYDNLKDYEDELKKYEPTLEAIKDFFIPYINNIQQKLPTNESFVTTGCGTKLIFT